MKEPDREILLFFYGIITSHYCKLPVSLKPVTDEYKLQQPDQANSAIGIIDPADMGGNQRIIFLYARFIGGRYLIYPEPCQLFPAHSQKKMEKRQGGWPVSALLPAPAWHPHFPGYHPHQSKSKFIPE
jgi:hypothetical protein